MTDGVRAFHVRGLRRVTLTNGSIETAERPLSAARAGMATGWVNRNGGQYPGYFSTAT